MDLFIYGTLQSPQLLAAVSGSDTLVTRPATLSGYSIGPVAGDVVPYVYQNAAGTCEGRLVSKLSKASWDRLDAYEGAFGYSLIDVMVDTQQGPHAAKMYYPPTDIPFAQGEWSFKKWQDNWEDLAVRGATDLFRSDPGLTAQEIRTQWPMIQCRAWSRTLAARTKADFQLRGERMATDMSILDRPPPRGDFFRFDKATLRTKTFAGTQSPPLTREMLIGVDAAFVLPYDPDRDRVLLLEQFRLGAGLRDDPCPWLLEPVAGMIDARESSQDCAQREALEEAHLSQLTLHPVAAVYASPGTTTDFHHLFIGMADLPDDHPSYGGLEAENEDIRLHLVPRNVAQEMVQSGEINVGPLVTMLMWLQINADRLRGKG